MSAFLVLAFLAGFFIVLGMAATAFGVDSRDGFGNDSMYPRFR